MKSNTKANQEVSFEPDYSFGITASDTVDIPIIGATLHVNKSGFYNLLLTANETPVKKYLVAGVDYPYRIKRLFITDTDVGILDGLVGLASVYIEIDKT